ncbi:hypothetical protein K474DRAFT_1680811, partial [Panus rudis PR-1116 ss-1]
MRVWAIISALVTVLLFTIMDPSGTGRSFESSQASALASQYTCVPNCLKGPFATPRALAIHENSCDKKKKADEEQDARLAAAFAAKAKANEERTLKRRRLEEDLHMQGLEGAAQAVHNCAMNELDLDRQLQLDVDVPMQELTPISPAPVLDEPCGRGRRRKRPTWKILEQLPQPPAPVPTTASEGSPSESSPDVATCNAGVQSNRGVIPNIVRTATNAFGLFREYFTVPSRVADNPGSLQPGSPTVTSVARGSKASPESEIQGSR